MGRIDGLTFLLLPLTVNNRVNFLFYLSARQKMLWYAGLQDCSLKNMQYDILPLLIAAKREKGKSFGDMLSSGSSSAKKETKFSQN